MSTASTHPQRLYLMRVGTIPERNLPFVCYLIQMADGKNILIDSGLPTDVHPPAGMPTPTLEKNVVEQLAMLGLTPDNIDVLICTHFDGDHTGYHEAFPRAELIVQRRHYTIAQNHPRFMRSRSHWDQPVERYRFVDGDTTLFPGVELIETSGHAPGHQSVLVRLPETGAVLLAIDAVPAQSAFTVDRQPAPSDDNKDELIASTQKLLDLVEREQVTLVVFGHDGTQWQTIKKLPDYYA
ncbi:MAG: N-acyl homoserine lactonase family protein [Chloroflexota bacterium]